MAHESYYTRKLLDALETEGFFQKISDRFHGGVLDVIGCVAGRYVTIEVKKDSNGLTPAQKETINKALAAHGSVFVATYLTKHKRWDLDDRLMPERIIKNKYNEAAKWLLERIYLHINEDCLTWQRTKLSSLSSMNRA